MPANTRDIDLCISALSALKVSREAYASSEKHDHLRQALADALKLFGSDARENLCDAISDAIRTYG